MLTIDARCGDPRCKVRSQDIYRMIGSCDNCGTQGILILYSVDHETGRQDCPVCKTHSVRNRRLATPDEFPEAESAGGEEPFAQMVGRVYRNALAGWARRRSP